MKNKKIIPILMAVFILVGIIVTCVLGLNFDLSYSAHKQIDIQIGKEFDNKEMKTLVKEVVGNRNVTIQKVELYEDMVSIGIADISEEELQNLTTKINEKYEIENTVENIAVTSVPNVRGRDLIKPYLMPIAISFLIILAYIICYVLIKKHLGKKINMVKAILGTIEIIVEFELLYLALLAITRLPVTALTIPIAIIIYVLTTIGSMAYLEKQ